MKLTQALCSLNSAFAFAFFLNGHCLAYSFPAQEKPISKSFDQLTNLHKKKKNILDAIKKNKAFDLNNFGIENSMLVNGMKQAFHKQPRPNNISLFRQVRVFNFSLAINLSNNPLRYAF